MDKKGQVEAGVGGFVMLAVAVIVGAILLTAAAQQVGTVTNTITVANGTLGTLTNGTTSYITAYKACSSFKIWNATGNREIQTTNYTKTDNAINPTTGALSIGIAPAVLVDAGYAYNKGTATFDGVCEPLTYASDAGGRTMANLVIIMMAMAVASIAIVYAMRNYYG